MRGWAGSSRRVTLRGATTADEPRGRLCLSAFARRCHAAVSLLFILMPAVWLGGGCAARRPVVTEIPPSPVSERAVTPEVARTPRPAPEGEAFSPLPGTDRVYPSQDPRNQARPGAPEAFPLTGALEAPGAGVPVAAEVVEQPALTPAAGNAAPDSVAAEPGTAESAAESPPPAAAWSVQLLASSSMPVARERAESLAPYFAEPTRVEPEGGLFKVRVGRCGSRDEAEALRRRASELGLRDAFVVPPKAGGGPPR
jgi:hypothetical protein